MFRSDAKLNLVKKCWHRGLPAQLHIHWLLSYMYMLIISVIYSTTIAMYKQPILPTHVNGHWSTFLVEEKKKEMIPFNWLDTKPQSYWATYLQNHCDWQWRTCSDCHITPAQKQTHSVTCNSVVSGPTKLRVH